MLEVDSAVGVALRPMIRHSLIDRLVTERLLAERALRELPGLRAMSRPRALEWLNTLVLDIQRAQSIPNRKTIARRRDEAIVAIGLLGIALDRSRGRAAELDALWDRAIAQVGSWVEALTTIVM